VLRHCMLSCALLGGLGVGANAQLAAGFGPAARGTSSPAAGWETIAQMATSLRSEHAFGGMDLEGTLERHSAALRLAHLSGSSMLISPSVGGFRAVVTGSATRDREGTESVLNRVASTAISYRRGYSGGWLGYAAADSSTPKYLAGLWRQIGSRVIVSIGTTIRRGAFGGRPSSTWQQTVYDSSYADSSGWQRYNYRTMTFGDSGRPASRLTWAETEARLGGTLGPLALDASVGWRPRLDSSRSAAWVRGFVTAPIARGLAVSAGVGTMTRQLPFTRSAGRFASLSLRVSPVALLRPRPTPEVTPAASAFGVVKNAAGERVVRIAVPGARIVELSGDFNGWKVVRLRRVREDLWEVALPIAPGTYRMNVRIDGERWIAPPGTATIEDEFNGQVGLVIVR
jgi:hypothetical protein